jgi:N6-L-threonylcarbamoyladenine synthase
MMINRTGEEGRQIYFPALPLCTDNAAMIAGNAHHYYLDGQFAPLNVNAYPGLMSL